MNRFIFLFAITLTASIAAAQQAYDTKTAIRYYEEPGAAADRYKDTQCVFDFYYPKGVKDFPTIVWFHGGGITGGRRELPNELKNKGFAVLGVGYRLSPKVKSPVFVEDAAASVAWAFKHIGKFGGNAKLIFVSGHSAGAYLGMMLTLDKSYLRKYGIDANSIAGLISFSAQVVTHFTVRQEKGYRDNQPTIDSMAPLFHVRKDAPPILLITGDRELELLGRYEENAYLWRVMKLNGNTTTTLHELQGFDHGTMRDVSFPLLIKEVRVRTKEILKN